MARLSSSQRVVRSIPDRGGNNYTKTSAGGQQRITSAVKYLDEHQKTQLYKLADNRLVETDRYEAKAQIDETTTKYQQHLTFTTSISGDSEVDHTQAALLVAQAVQERRPDAEIYGVAVHQQEHGNVHMHICFGTDTTLRRGAEGDLVHFQNKAYEIEQKLLADMTPEQTYIRGQERVIELEPEDIKPQDEDTQGGGQSRQIEGEDQESEKPRERQRGWDW